MGSKQIRVGQLIAPFGPGSLYTDRRGTPHVVCGLDHWFMRFDSIGGMTPCEKPDEFERFEPRLSDLLRVNRFRTPTDYRAVRQGQTPPPNAGMKIPAVRFPRWYRHTKTGELKRFNLHSTKVDHPPGGGRWVAVRFVSVCEGGHLCEFPWKEWIDCSCPGDGKLVLTDRGGSELSSIRVHCETCPEGSAGRKGKTLASTTKRPDPEGGEQSAFQDAGIVCPGDRPWLGEGASDGACGQPLVAALINQTNLYFPRTISAILLPEVGAHDDRVIELRTRIEEDPVECGMAKTYWSMGRKPRAAVLIQDSLKQRGIECSEEEALKALESIFEKTGSSGLVARRPSAPESELLAFRRAEFDIIRNEVNDSKRIPNLRVIPAGVSPAVSKWFSKVNMVERLRETRVFFGFDRLEAGRNPLAGMPHTALHQLFRSPPRAPQEQWLPAVEVYGEGIYVELNLDSLATWRQANAQWITERLGDAFVQRLASVYQTLPPLTAASRDWAATYLVVHSLAHILLNQLVYECGYSTSALRERLYVSTDSQASMAGLLIYTAAGDSEGTLGGLVRLARPERFEPIVRRALNRALWCSSDPICSENLGGTGSRLANLAACHACVLLPETACETINQGLDRSLVVGTPAQREMGFMAELLEAHSID